MVKRLKGRMAKIIDLFSGAGGLSLGAARAGFKVAAAVEINPNALSSHKTNFPHTIHIQHDITKLDGSTLLNLAQMKPNDLVGIIGGPPCQGFSSIGHKNIDDERNRLFEKFFSLVQELKPLFFVAENVPGIMNQKYDKIRASAFSYVEDYHLLPPLSVNASEYGAPTTRTRYFFIGYRNHPSLQPFTTKDIERFKVNEEEKTNVLAALEGLPLDANIFYNTSGYARLQHEYFEKHETRLQSEFFFQRVTGKRPSDIGDLEYVTRYESYREVNGCLPTRHTQAVRKRFSELHIGQQDRVSKSPRLNPEGFCPTLRAGTGPEKGSFQAVRPIHYLEPRVITPREAARLQGFPDWYKLPDTIWHSFRQIGNSVSPIAAERILHAIFQKLT